MSSLQCGLQVRRSFRLAMPLKLSGPGEHNLDSAVSGRIQQFLFAVVAKTAASGGDGARGGTVPQLVTLGSAGTRTVGWALVQDGDVVLQLPSLGPGTRE